MKLVVVRYLVNVRDIYILSMTKEEGDWPSTGGEETD